MVKNKDDLVLIGCDFSINKPALCLQKNNKLTFISWPYSLTKPVLEVFKNSPISIIERTDNKDKGTGVSDKLRYEIKNAKYLATLILDTIKPFINNNTYIAFEGLSYGSSGNVTLQLGGYKYILMDLLSTIVPLENMETFAPITLKKTAGCSKKGTKKSDVIEAFKNMPTKFS